MTTERIKIAVTRKSQYSSIERTREILMFEEDWQNAIFLKVVLIIFKITSLTYQLMIENLFLRVLHLKNGITCGLMRMRKMNTTAFNEAHQILALIFNFICIILFIVQISGGPTPHDNQMIYALHITNLFLTTTYWIPRLLRG